MDRQTDRQTDTWRTHLLSDLHDCFPEVVGFASMTRLTHLILDDELHDKFLLQDGRSEHLLLHGQLDFQPLGMRLCPDKSGINKTNLHASTKNEEAWRVLNKREIADVSGKLSASMKIVTTQES